MFCTVIKYLLKSDLYRINLSVCIIKTRFNLCYSCLNESVGFLSAARIDCILITAYAITRAITDATTNDQTGISIL